MFDDFYGLKGRPFQLTPDPAFYFESLTHRKALSYLGYGLAQGEGFIVVTGEIGAGKTTLVGHLLATLDPARVTAITLVSTADGKASIVVRVSPDLGARYDAVALVRAASAAVGGEGGGGRRDLAQAGGPQSERAEEALEAVRTALRG